MQIKKLKVKDKWNRDFGILTYDTTKDTFHFKYDDNCEGYAFSDINVKNGREFEQDTIFNVLISEKAYPLQLSSYLKWNVSFVVS